MLKRIQDELAKAQDQARLSEEGVASVQDQLRRCDSLQDDIEQQDIEQQDIEQQDIEQQDKRLGSMVKQNHHMQALQAIPGIVSLTATALVSTATDLSSFDRIHVDKSLPGCG